VIDIARGPAEAFGPLKAVVQSISILCEKYQVCVHTSFKVALLQPNLQNIAAVKDKIQILLSRITALEKLFESPAGDEKEIKRREGISVYAISFHSDWMLNLFPGNSRVLKSDCRCLVGSPHLCNTLTMHKTMMISLDFLKIYRRLSMTTWFVHNFDPLLGADHNNRWYNKWQSMIKDVNSWCVLPPFMSEQLD